jgi:hypothetical protein
METNVRISDVIHTLADPVEYVRGVVGSFVEYQFDKATSVVRNRGDMYSTAGATRTSE